MRRNVGEIVNKGNMYVIKMEIYITGAFHHVIIQVIIQGGGSWHRPDPCNVRFEALSFLDRELGSLVA